VAIVLTGTRVEAMVEDLHAAVLPPLPPPKIWRGEEEEEEGCKGK